MKFLIMPTIFLLSLIWAGGSLLWTVVELVSWLFGDPFNINAVALLGVTGLASLVSWFFIRKEFEIEKVKNDEIYKNSIAAVDRVPADGAELGV